MTSLDPPAAVPAPAAAPVAAPVAVPTSGGPSALSWQAIFQAGLWDQNVVFGQMLSLCPTMALTTSATNGLGMGLATLAVLAMTNPLIAALRHVIPSEVRIPAFVLIIATIVTLVDMSINAWLHELYKVLGLFIPLIVVNCLILGRAEAFASRQPVLASFLDGLAMGAGFTLALVLVGAVREVIGSGTLFSNASLLLGPWASFLEMRVVPDYSGVLVMILPPGGFITVGCLLAVKRLLEQKRQQKARHDSIPLAA
jgi:electron transport complex protein RnfE